MKLRHLYSVPVAALAATAMIPLALLASGPTTDDMYRPDLGRARCVEQDKKILGAFEGLWAWALK